MPSLGLLSSLSKSVSALSSYVRDGLKLYMPYNSPKEVKFVGEGSTYFADDYIDIGNESSLSFGAGSFSIACWVKSTQVPSYATKFILGKASSRTVASSSGYSLYIGGTGTLWSFTVGDGSDHVVVDDTATHNVWTHVTGTFDGVTKTAKIYVDGIMKEEEANTDIGDIDSSDEFEIGRIASDTGGDWLGSIKNVAVWSRVLSATEVQNVMYKTYVELNSYSGTLIQGLVSWWPLSEGSAGWLGSTALDSHGSNHGTGVSMDYTAMTTSLYGGITPLIPRGFDNAPTVQADAIGTGYANFVDGSSNYILIADADALDPAEQLTVMAWIKPDDIAGTEGIVGKREATEQAGAWHLTKNDDDILFGIYSGSGSSQSVTASTVLTAGKWTHVVATMNDADNDCFIYIDGILKASDLSTITNNFTANSHPLHIGFSGQGAEYFDGKIKNVGVWDAVLTQAQIQSIMEKTYSELTATEKSTLVSWWGLDSVVTNDGSEDIVADEHDTTFGSNITPTWEDSGRERTASVSGQVITIPAGSGTCQLTASVSSGTIKVNATITNFSGSGTISLPWDGNGSSSMQVSEVSANGTYEYYEHASDASWVLDVSSTAACTITINSMVKADGNMGALK